MPAGTTAGHQAGQVRRFDTADALPNPRAHRLCEAVPRDLWAERVLFERSQEPQQPAANAWGQCFTTGVCRPRHPNQERRRAPKERI